MHFRFTGHESFPCRYTWLPKAYTALTRDPAIFNNDNLAMIQFGVGKNMVKAMRFWIQVMGLAMPTTNNRFEITTFGHAIFHPSGFDPFLEDVKTLWLLHWKISSHVEQPLFSWYYLLNKWPYQEFSKSEVIKVFNAESQRLDRPLSRFTLEQHFDIFLHTYVPTTGKKGIVLEDNLDCPLTELRFIKPIGERNANDTGRRETIYSFVRNNKKDITGALFAYCIYDYWQLNRSGEATLSFRDIAVLPNSVGQIFKLSEANIRERLDQLDKDSKSLLQYHSSATLPRVTKSNKDNLLITEAILLSSIYGRSPEDFFNVQQIEEEIV